MKKSFLSLIILSAIIFSSCEENFNPFGEYEERYVLNCILRGDTALQVAAVARTYDPGGFDPYQNTDDPFMANADVRIWYRDSVYVFKDTLIERQDTSRYKSLMHLYTSNKFKIDFDEPIEIEVMLPNGRRLKSSTHTSARTSFLSNNASTIPGSASFINIGWTPQASQVYYSPEFSFIYFKKEGNENIKYEKRIPVKYENDEPVYLKPMRQTSVTVTLATIIRALEEISENDPVKSNYSIELKPVFKVATYDEALSKYYSTSSQTFETLSVRVDENDYTNVVGGFGLFGSFTSARYQNLKFSSGFITSFGYKVIDQE